MTSPATDNNTPPDDDDDVKITAADADAAATDSAAAQAGPSVLQGRELEWAQNSPTLESFHRERNGPIVRTRFPPEPNGYLHIGHAKSMNMNFRLAFDKLQVPMEHRRTIFRYDDTNPEAESEEYIKSIENDLLWLGWKPERTTYSSDNFQRLYDFAVQLIQKNLAYVCDMTSNEIKAQRELALMRANCYNSNRNPDDEGYPLDPKLIPGRNRNTSIERNLELFEKMKLGCYDEGSYTLRLKMDMESSNPNMYDLIAYRIKYIKHPHSGKGWCIYPAYDWTHGICDSLEDIDYSICTLEFESRREPYYWILWALDLYRPKVYEMSRLNVEATVLSKRKLITLVDQNFVRGWDDCRMPTISGLRRRGYTATIINTFCQDVGATRAANIVELKKLEQTARYILSQSSRRCMATLQPIQVIITNYKDIVGNDNNNSNSNIEFQVANIPTDESLGMHTITLTSTIYIDASDFRLHNDNDDDYYGLAPNQLVGLKYHGGNLICDDVITMEEEEEEKQEQGLNNNNNKNNNNNSNNKTTKIKCLHCHLDVSESRPKPKSYLSWVPENGISCEVRVYNPLFVVPEPTDDWMNELNPNSEIVYHEAMIDPSALDLIDGTTVSKWKSNPSFQFERLGYFVVDYETTYNKDTNPKGNIIFNRTVSLKEEISKQKQQLSTVEMNKLNDRRLQQKLDKEAKERRMKIDPKLYFKEWDEYINKFSQYDDNGIPTHDHEGNELTKSAIKKLIKEQQKHIKQQMAWKK